MRIAFIIGYNSIAIPTLREVLEEESLKYNFKFIVTTPADCLKHIEEINTANAIFVYSHFGEIPAEFEKVLQGKIVFSICPEIPSKCPANLLLKAHEFWISGGKENFRGLIRLILRCLGLDVEVPEVVRIPWHGIYHPKLGLFEDVEDYLKVYARSPLVGILFYRDHILYKATEHVEKLIKAIEAQGLGVIAVFTKKYQNERIEIPGIEETIKKFFFKKGNRLVETIVNLTPFSLFTKGEIELLKNLNVPIINPVTSFYQSVEEWKNSDSIDYLSQVFSIILPELDGLIEPITYTFSEFEYYGSRKYVTFDPHAEFIAKRVRKWIEIRKKKPEERRIAIVLINPPCKGVEANIGVGFGLDVPESVVRLLKKLKENGYFVENIPNDGKELIKMFLERKAISEFRWTSIEEIIAKGGVLDFVDYETYSTWLNELSEDVKNKLLKDWGDPKDVLEKKIKKEFVGMVYEGKFVIPGLRFGNVVVLTQPKFGCSGSVCDGSVCRILHEPTITPPHQWFAVYRWLTRVFKADLLIHFGTHGYLEFRPGKGVGLSPSCWPEISIDNAPHVYVYAVSNPMEGMIAKRRSYATIIDHLYPPMELAEVFEDLENLIAQYKNAKNLGEVLRAEKIYEEIVEKAEKVNIRFHKDRAIEEIHNYLTTVKETQIESGLHIFGSLREEKLADYIATIMAFDTPEFPSIRRILAEALGFNYEELKQNPSEVNALGITNSQTLSFLHKLAVNMLRKLLKMNIEEVEPELIEKILNEEVIKLARIEKSV
ncbi:MAG: cobaltochelatase subunit CobN [Candidatus Methanomethylicaceae archaeon]